MRNKNLLGGVPEGFIPFMVARLARQHERLLFVASHNGQYETLMDIVPRIAPDVKLLGFPAWDTVPYDRVSPHAEIEGIRMKTLTALASGEAGCVVTSLDALLQRVPPVSFFKNRSLTLKTNQDYPQDQLLAFLAQNGYKSTPQVLEVGEYAVRGGLMDIFPAGYESPVRLDFFGDTLEKMTYFDVATQVSTQKVDNICLNGESALVLDADTIARFRTRYRELFAQTDKDPLYESISAGQKPAGIEHWMPLFFEKMNSLFDYVPKDTFVVLPDNLSALVRQATEQIQSHYQARLQAVSATSEEAVYHPVPPESFFLDDKELKKATADFECVTLSPFVSEQGEDMGGRAGERFTGDRWPALLSLMKKEKVVVAALSAVSQKRLIDLFKERGLSVHKATSFDEAVRKAPAVVVLPIAEGVRTPDWTLVAEEDILGERPRRIGRTKKARENFIEDISTLNEGDLVVHIAHGVGRYMGLQTIETGGVQHDFLCVVYEGGDKLFVPVENLDVLTRYGSENTAVRLDKLGTGAWEARKGRVKKYLLEMAEKLIAVAAQRLSAPTEKLSPPEGHYQEFCSRFSYVETDDQLNTITDVLSDFQKGHPMDRLVCGDVGFGKTEIALRAAFVAALNGLQVAVVVPTTLLAQQHFNTFAKRFEGFPVKIRQLSRLVSSKERQETLKGLADGTVDIVVGTHALLAKSVSFHHLGLLVIDEEQHFGVAHKERLKELKNNVHVLTMTATPIPRTLQMSLTGVRDLSVIATPPIDRLAVSTFVLPFDSLIIRDALLREKRRKGQVFYVCPRISDLPFVAERLRVLVPEVKITVANGQMPPAQLEKIMTDFVHHKYDVLLATSIIESGLDIPSVNTIVVHHADHFGLAELYQLRGRVGRSKLKAYAYLTTEPNKALTPAAQKRLTIMQSLDSLGAGFTLASQDLDMRGAGNLLGREQSGHIKEVGTELYQKMLEEAVAVLRTGQEQVAADWTPQINLGVSVLIPETYVSDLSLRMQLYHQLAGLTQDADIEQMKEDLKDRFGPVPLEVANLLESLRIKALCRQAYVERLDAGDKGVSLRFYQNTFPNPAGLVTFIQNQMGLAQLQPDKLVLIRTWPTPEDRLFGVQRILRILANLASL
ncbi:MAG: transcription-repair coupling factor [Alphaproteobacteria bacterium]|nr:transcription-repair coupling factor [Alphaproteobacteria bacterium]